MKALFNFIPSYCPVCGIRLFDPGKAEYLNTLRATIDDYHNGQSFTCACGLVFEYETGKHRKEGANDLQERP